MAKKTRVVKPIARYQFSMRVEEDLARAIELYAADEDTSWNNACITLIWAGLSEMKERAKLQQEPPWPDPGPDEG